ncbi:MAG: hypothetical protein ACR2LC_15445 [Pyrinomonadaceae bacterium]
MHLSEILIIYMAIAAPHGVAFFLQAGSAQSLTRRLIGVSGATLLWPLVWLRRARKGIGRRFVFQDEDHSTNEADFAEMESATFAGIESASRELLAAFADADESLRSIKVSTSELAAYEFRELLEKYVGLTRIAAANSVSPSAREMETARLGGRRGDDLFLAGLCTHRRNNARLADHLNIARARLLQSLTELCCRAPERLLPLPADKAGENDLSERTLRVYACAIDLASLLEDRETALRIAPLLDAQCARLQTLDEATTTEDSPTVFSHEEERCLTTHAGHAVSTTRRSNENFTQA